MNIDEIKDTIEDACEMIIDLQRRIDKAIEYNNHLIEHAKYHLNLGHLKKMKKILEGSDEIYKKCWNKYIELELKGDSSNE